MYTVSWSKNGNTYQSKTFANATLANAEWENLKKQGFKYGGVAFGNNPIPNVPKSINLLHVGLAAAAIIFLPKLLKK
jgi:hypothetical protein